MKVWKLFYLNYFSDTIDAVRQQALHSLVVIHVISMPYAHEKNVRREPWNGVHHGTGIHVYDEMLNNFVLILAGELDHTTDLLMFNLKQNREQIL